MAKQPPPTIDSEDVELLLMSSADLARHSGGKPLTELEILQANRRNLSPELQNRLENLEVSGRTADLQQNPPAKPYPPASQVTVQPDLTGLPVVQKQPAPDFPVEQVVVKDKEEPKAEKPAQVYETYVRQMEREAADRAAVVAREKHYYESQDFQEGLVDNRQLLEARISNLREGEDALVAHAAQYEELKQKRLSTGEAEPSFEELRAKKALEDLPKLEAAKYLENYPPGFELSEDEKKLKAAADAVTPLSDEDYQHELDNYRREHGLDLAREQAEQNRVAKQSFEADVELESLEQAKGLASLTYLDVRGAFYKVDLLDSNQASKARGIYAIEEMERYAREAEAGQLEAPILITGVETTQRDVTSQLSCLNNAKVFYTFGQNFGNVMIGGEILLGPMGNMTVGERGGVRRLLDFFWTYRVSVYEKPITVSVCGEAFYVYLTGMGLGKVDPDLHTLAFVLTGTLLDLSRDDLKSNASNINPGSSINSQSGLEQGLLISDHLLSEPSLRGPSGNVAAQKVDVENVIDPSFRNAWDAAVTGGHGGFAKSSTDQLAERDREVDMRRRIAAGIAAGNPTSAQRQEALISPDQARINAHGVAALKADLSANPSLTEPSIYTGDLATQRRAALNQAAYDVAAKKSDLESALADANSPEAKAEAFSLAASRNPRLFGNVLSSEVQGDIIPSQVPPEAQRLERIKAKAETEAGKKADNYMPGIGFLSPDQQLLRRTYYSDQVIAKEITINMLALQTAAENNRYPVSEYNRLAAEFGKQKITEP